MIKIKHKLLNSELSKQLYEKLKSVWDFENWSLGVMSSLKTDEERKIILDMIESGEMNPNKYQMKALEFRGVIGIPDEEFDGNPEDVINIDEE